MIDRDTVGVLQTQFMLWRSAAGSAQAGGDWCDVFTLPDGSVGLTIGDVCGHGLDVAGTMFTMRATVLEAMFDARAPSNVLAAVNGVACTLGGGVIVTAIVALVDEREATLTFANAGHPAPLLLTDEAHAFIEHRPADLPLGIFAPYHAADYVIALPADALIIFYTDGVTEHDRDPVQGEIELVNAARIAHGRPNLNAARAIARRVFNGQRGDDDAAMLCVRTGPARTGRPATNGHATV